MKKNLKKIAGTLFLIMFYFLIIAQIDNYICYATNSIVKVEEIDMGDYQSEMVLGEKQLLNVTILPENSTNETIKYYSSNEKIATINGLGRITAISEGKTTISVSAGNIEESFELTVIRAKADEETIKVTDIEVGNYTKEIEVDKTQNLSPTVVPSNATNSNISYSSSDTSIATVSSSGEVKGIAPGNVTINISADGITKSVNLKIKVGTTNIQLNSNYLILKVGEEFKINAKAIPENASQDILYKSLNSNIATVTTTGNIVAKSIGNATIIVSNGDMSKAITVIVNEVGQTSSNNLSEENIEDYVLEEKLTDNEKDLINKIETESSIKINTSNFEIITKSILKKLYEKKAILSIEGEGYTIVINGKDIVNYENELTTLLKFNKEKKGTSFVLNSNNNLPGRITIELNNKQIKYIYLYNNSKEKYEILDNKNKSYVELDEGGKYFITDKKLYNTNIPLIGIIIGSTLILAGVITYIVVKKKYWFW
ncbi:MAG: Ig-like domain-containing protein [Clostridium sp.]|nr:Ig-like domain-containing protein [Clostridium sp.]